MTKGRICLWYYSITLVFPPCIEACVWGREQCSASTFPVTKHYWHFWLSFFNYKGSIWDHSCFLVNSGSSRSNDSIVAYSTRKPSFVIYFSLLNLVLVCVYMAKVWKNSLPIFPFTWCYRIIQGKDLLRQLWLYHQQPVLYLIYLQFLFRKIGKKLISDSGFSPLFWCCQKDCGNKSSYYIDLAITFEFLCDRLDFTCRKWVELA